jgi:hypothetical protein
MKTLMTFVKKLFSKKLTQPATRPLIVPAGFRKLTPDEMASIRSGKLLTK